MVSRKPSPLGQMKTAGELVLPRPTLEMRGRPSHAVGLNVLLIPS